MGRCCCSIATATSTCGEPAPRSSGPSGAFIAASVARITSGMKMLPSTVFVWPRELTTAPDGLLLKRLHHRCRHGIRGGDRREAPVGFECRQDRVVDVRGGEHLS